MNNETITDALLREFLLGRVSDEERARIESQFVTDSQARERILAVEGDLIEDYLEGTLSTEDQERFVARYTQTDEQRRKLRITKSIKDWAMTQAASAQTEPRKFSDWSGSPWFRWKPFVIPIAVAALILIVVAGIWLKGRTGSAGIEQELAQLNAPSNQPDPPVSLELSPVTLRGAGSGAQLNVRSGVVVLRLLWLEKERYSSYQATVRRVGDNPSYVVKNLQPEADGRSIRLKLPAHMLSRGTYQITLTGDSSQTSEEYTFTVPG